MDHHPAAVRAQLPISFRAGRSVAFGMAVGSAVVASGIVALALKLHLSVSVTGIFVGAVVVSTWFGGLAPGLTAISVLLVLMSRILLPPSPTFGSWFQLIGFVSFNLFLCCFVGMRRRIFARLVIELLQYRSILYWAPVAIILFGRDRTVQFFNPAFEKLYGWTLDELRGRPLPLPESERDAWESLDEILRNGGSFMNQPARRLRKDRTEIDVRISGTPVRDDAGVVAGLVGLAFEAEPKPEVLLERKRLEYLVNNSSDFVCITDLDQRVQFINNTGKDMVGLSEGESGVGMHLLSFIEDADQGTLTDKMLPMAQDGVGLEFPLRLKNINNGNQVPVHGTIRGMVGPKTNSIEFFAYIFQNRSDLNRAIASRVRAEKAFNTLLGCVPVAVALVNREGQPFDSNEHFQKLLGYTADEVKQGPFSRFVHPEDLPRGREIFLELASGKTESYQVNKRLCDKNGNLFWAKMTVNLVRGDGGEPSYCISMVEPISPAAELAGVSQPIRLVC